MKRPSVLYPTLVRGFIRAPEYRCQSIDGSEIWFPIPDGEMYFQNVAPFVVDGKTYFISHLQKKATHFSLLYDPFIFHHWVGKPQKYHIGDGGVVVWEPGTEKGNLWLGGYWRTCGWRWQIPDEKSDGTPWIFSGGRIPGGHLD